MRKLFVFLFVIFGFAFQVAAQTPAPAPSASQTWTLTGMPIILPGNQSTLVAAEAGVEFQVTPNFYFRDTNLVAANAQGYYGGIKYTLPAFSTMIGNVSPAISATRLQLYITASAGIDHITTGAVAKAHYSFLAGGGFNYDVTGSGRWTLGAEVQYAKLPGLANNTAIVSFGPALHF